MSSKHFLSYVVVCRIEKYWYRKILVSSQYHVNTGPVLVIPILIQILLTIKMAYVGEGSEMNEINHQFAKSEHIFQLFVGFFFGDLECKCTWL